MFKKIALAASCLTALAGQAFAQAANISATDLTPAGFNTGLLMQVAPSPTYVSNDGETLLVARTGASAVTATIRTKATQMSQAGFGTVALTDQAVVIPSGTTIIMGPFPTGRWNDTAYGTVKVDFTGAISVTSVRVPQ